jgi:uncharacterized protein (DUF433 family)
MFSKSGTSTAHTRFLLLKEAAILARVTEKKVRHELEEGTMAPDRSESGRPLFRARALVFLRLIEGIRVNLSREDRHDLYRLLTKRLSSVGHWRVEAADLVLSGDVPARFHIGSTISETAKVLWKYRRARRRVISDPAILGGEPVFEGTRVAVNHVGQLALRGTPLDQLREDFPSLRDEDFEFARFLATLGKGPGRPRKPLELRRGA